MKLKELYELWYQHKKRQIKISSLSSYSYIYKTKLEVELGDMEISALSKKVVRPLIYKMLDEGLSENYCKDTLVVLKNMLLYAEDELDEDIPSIQWGIKWPTRNKQSTNKLERYTPMDFRKIVDYIIQNPSPKSLGVLISLCSGMRVGEVCALKWHDVDLVNKVFIVNKTMQRVAIYGEKSFIQEGPPKTASSNRSIPISKEILQILKKFNAVSRPDYYVTTCSERFIEPRTLSAYYKSLILDKIGLSECIKFHGLRHTFATTLIENKVDVKTVSSLLGHADVGTTLNVYVHPSEDIKRDAVNNGMKKIFK